MADQIIVNVTPFETRVALLENNVVAELFIERHRDRGIVGNIYLGKVQRVLPGMQAAFVEIGHERAAFLYVGDVVPPEAVDDEAGHEHGEPDDGQVQVERIGADTEGADLAEPTDPGLAAKAAETHAQNVQKHRERRRAAVKDRRIEELLKQGQDVLVQVTKDAIGTKGPRVTCNVSLPGRHLVYMPTHRHIGISRRITQDEERARLKNTLEALREKHKQPDLSPVGGFVVRTVSEGIASDKLEADAEFLIHMWREVERRAKIVAAPVLVQPELDIVLRSARDMFTADVDRFVIDEPTTFAAVSRFVELLDPALLPRLSLHKGPEPLFEQTGIETEIQRAMSRRVWLKSGGYLVIDQAEALTAIDVNTGRFVGKRNLEDTIVRTNLEAVKEVAYQLRLRNIGGMVIIDFIDMEDESARERVLDALKSELERDRARSNVVKMSELGLVEMTRQRTRESLGRQLTETCWYCEGRGALKSKRTLAYEIFRAIERQAPRLQEPFVIIQAHPEVVDLMLSEEQAALVQLEQRVGKKLIVRPRGSFHQEQFDIFGTNQDATPRRSERDKSAKADAADKNERDKKAAEPTPSPGAMTPSVPTARPGRTPPRTGTSDAGKP